MSKEERDPRADLIGLLRIRREAISPPFIFPENNGKAFPTMDRTTIHDAIRNVWLTAFDEAAQTVADYYDAGDSWNGAGPVTGEMRREEER